MHYNVKNHYYDYNAFSFLSNRLVMKKKSSLKG